MSAFPQHERPSGLSDAPALGEQPLTPDGATDALPVLADAASVVRRYPAPAELSRGSSVAMMPAVQAAAVAAGGFVAGAAVVSLVARRQRRAAGLTKAKGRHAGRRLRRSGAGRRSASGAGEILQIVGSRSLLVDVHLLGGRE